METKIALFYIYIFFAVAMVMAAGIRCYEQGKSFGYAVKVSFWAGLFWPMVLIVALFTRALDRD